MKDFVDHISKYATLLQKGAVWENTDEILAPVLSEEEKLQATNDYIYEFYCYLCVILDLSSNYKLEFVEGEKEFQYNFPRKAALKKGKPRFHAKEDDQLAFQICAGTRVRCDFDRENNHPDISFQLADATDDPTEQDLIIIMDAKFTEDLSSRLSRTEFYKFGSITDLFNLRGVPKVAIKLKKLKKMFGNCLITNAKAYSDAADIRLLNKWNIKEVENFMPGKTAVIIG
jgi:hypothetical protein